MTRLVPSALAMDSGARVNVNQIYCGVSIVIGIPAGEDCGLETC